MASDKISDIKILSGVPNEFLDRISSIIDVPVNAFDVMDRDNGLFLVHFKREYPQYSHVKGVIVDVEYGGIVIDKSLDPINVVTDELIVENDELVLIDCENDRHSVKGYTFYPGYDGMVIRVFKRKGKVYFTSRKTLFFADKKWGEDVSFGKMWEELNGPNGKDLFGEEENSGYYYSFLMVHKKLLVSNRFMELNPGFIINQGITKTCYPETPATFKGKNIKVEPSMKEPEIIESKSLSLDEARLFLTTGLHPDVKLSENVRLRHGESLFVVGEDFVFRVMSEGAEYRKNLRNNKAFIPDRFLEHYTFVHKNVNKDNTIKNEKFMEHYIPIAASNSLIVNHEAVDIKGPLHIDAALSLVNRCFLVSLPPCNQSDYTKQLANFFKIRKEVSSKLFNIATSKNIPHGLHKRVCVIISNSKKYTDGGNHSFHDYDRKLRENIQFMVQREYPFSLYAIHNSLFY